jgi:hypothetical protein
MKTIPLTQGKAALVSEEDYDLVARHKWCAHKIGKSFYAVRHVSGNGKGIPTVNQWLHHAILPPKPGLQVDHKNRNTLDCRRENLRYATPSQNRVNRWDKTNKWGYRGVGKAKNAKSWFAYINIDGRRTYLGCSFSSPVEAARAYDTAARVMHGEFAQLNFPGDSNQGRD